jgi:hypothetical protein
VTADKNEKYIVRKPIYETGSAEKNRQGPLMTYISNKQIPGADHYVQMRWIKGMPQPNPRIHEHVHDFDEIILYWGGNYEVPQVLGGEIECYIGGEPITFNTTTGIYIPRGTPHGPVTWKKFDFPHLQINLMLGCGNREEAWGKSGIYVPKNNLPRKTKKFDYEQYVVRSPMREAGGKFKQGRQSPTMTHISGVQIPGVKVYIEAGWIWGVVDHSLPEMSHPNFEEIVLHFGSDPENPEDLGAEMDFNIGGEPKTFTSTFGVFLPKGVVHGPLTFKEARKPYVEMAIMLGAGNVKEGWQGSWRNRDSKEENKQE